MKKGYANNGNEAASTHDMDSQNLTDLGRQATSSSVEELALMLEIDLAFGRRPDFVNRLRRALDAMAAVQESMDNEPRH